jgi:hypothetical protein
VERRNYLEIDQEIRFKMVEEQVLLYATSSATLTVERQLNEYPSLTLV